MMAKKSKDYHDYFIKNGKFIGAFEEMYQAVDDLWCHRQAQAIQYDMALYLLDRYGLNKRKGKVLDIGCGKGAFTARMSKACSRLSFCACDLAPTAIKKAQKKYGNRRVSFEVMDIRKGYRTITGAYDLIVISQLMWCILPQFAQVVNTLSKNLKRNGYLLINQAFYSPKTQKYGKKVVSTVPDMLKLLKKYEPVEMVQIGDPRIDYCFIGLFSPRKR